MAYNDTQRNQIGECHEERRRGYVVYAGYLDVTLVNLSTTFTTKLPPVLTYPVYYLHVKAKPFGCSAVLRSLDMRWCVELGPHRKGTRSRSCGRRLIGTQRERLTSGRRDTWGPLRRLQLTTLSL